MKIVGYENDDVEAIPAKVERWYDRRSRSWVVQLKDNDGNQIGDALYCGRKETAINEEMRLLEKHNIKR